MLFKEVIGQIAVKQRLAEMVQQNRLSHALLFLGKPGSGALPLALAFTQFVVCEKVNQASAAAAPSLFGFDDTDEKLPKPLYYEACNECAACNKARQMVHPDIHFSYPVITKKSGSSPKSTEFITEWREFIQQQPYGNV